MKNAAGVIGGIGPMSTVYFYEMVTEMTEAATDQDHVNMIIFNHASIPDRTAFICGRSDESPLPDFTEDAKQLEEMGARFIVIPCNTAHYFYEGVARQVSIPVLNIVEEAVKFAGSEIPGLRKLGILATDGTIGAGVYENVCLRNGIECAVPDPDYQKRVMSLIYDVVKAGRQADADELNALINHLLDKGCDCVVLGCTELSLAGKQCGITDRRVLDSLKVLAMRTVTESGKKLRKEYLHF